MSFASIFSRKPKQIDCSYSWYIFLRDSCVLGVVADVASMLKIIFLECLIVRCLLICLTRMSIRDSELSFRPRVVPVIFFECSSRREKTPSSTTNENLTIIVFVCISMWPFYGKSHRTDNCVPTTDSSRYQETISHPFSLSPSISLFHTGTLLFRIFAVSCFRFRHQLHINKKKMLKRNCPILFLFSRHLLNLTWRYPFWAHLYQYEG